MKPPVPRLPKASFPIHPMVFSLKKKIEVCEANVQLLEERISILESLVNGR